MTKKLHSGPEWSVGLFRDPPVLTLYEAAVINVLGGKTMRYQHLGNGAVISPLVKTDRDYITIEVSVGLASHTIRLNITEDQAGNKFRGGCTMKPHQAVELVHQLQVAIAAARGERDPYSIMSAHDASRAADIGDTADAMRAAAKMKK